MRLQGSARGLAAIGTILTVIELIGCTHRGVLLPTEQERQLEGRALDLLVRASRSDADIVCANAMEALVHVARDSGKPSFAAAVDSDKPLVRYAGCISIGDCRDKSALGGLRRKLEDPDPRVRLGAAYALCRCGETRW